MTTAEAARPRSSSRPGTGVAIDPERLVARRWQANLKRRELSERIAALEFRYDNGKPVTVGRDALGKYETGFRQPSLDALRAICAVLECEPADLLFSGPPAEMPEEAVAQRAALAHNKDLIAFAGKFGLRYKNARSGRVYYGLPLEEAFTAYVNLLMAEKSGDPAVILEAEAAFGAALAAAPRASGPLTETMQEALAGRGWRRRGKGT